MTRAWLPQRAGSLGLNGGGAAAAVHPPQTPYSDADPPPHTLLNFDTGLLVATDPYLQQERIRHCTAGQTLTVIFNTDWLFPSEVSLRYSDRSALQSQARKDSMRLTAGTDAIRAQHVGCDKRCPTLKSTQKWTAQHRSRHTIITQPQTGMHRE